MNMTDRISGVDLVSAQCKASAIADSMIVAYWQEASGITADYHVAWAVLQLHELAGLLGFDLVASEVAA
jgi:hypothetical protein